MDYVGSSGCQLAVLSYRVDKMYSETATLEEIPHHIFELCLDDSPRRTVSLVLRRVRSQSTSMHSGKKYIRYTITPFTLEVYRESSALTYAISFLIKISKRSIPNCVDFANSLNVFWSQSLSI